MEVAQPHSPRITVHRFESKIFSRPNWYSKHGALWNPIFCFHNARGMHIAWFKKVKCTFRKQSYCIKWPSPIGVAKFKPMHCVRWACQWGEPNRTGKQTSETHRIVLSLATEIPLLEGVGQRQSFLRWSEQKKISWPNFFWVRRNKEKPKKKYYCVTCFIVSFSGCHV